MNEAEFAKVWDLLIVADVVSKSNKNPLDTTHNIEIDLADNQHKSNKLDDALGYITQHIIKN